MAVGNIERNMGKVSITDYGPDPFVVNIDRAAELNTSFLKTLWTGDNLQITLMSIPVNENKGLTIHQDIDEYTRVQSGEAIIQMGTDKDNLTYQARMNENYGVVIPAGTWHNFINIGDKPLQMFSIYSNSVVPYGTDQVTNGGPEGISDVEVNIEQSLPVETPSEIREEVIEELNESNT